MPRPLPDRVDVLYDAQDLVVIDKPPGLPSTGRDLNDPACAQAIAIRQLGARLWAVHQLDADTSGALVLTRRSALVATTTWRMKGGKDYLLICHGVPGWQRRRVESPLTYSKKLRRWQVQADGRPATTLLRVRAAGARHALLEARLLTGRTHQIRAHLEHLGHPLVGESRYRTPPCDAHPRHALHAARVRLKAGEGGVERVEVHASLPPELRALAERLGIDPGDA